MFIRCWCRHYRVPTPGTGLGVAVGGVSPIAGAGIGNVGISGGTGAIGVGCGIGVKGPGGAGGI